uniref:DUF255 domain-containing protein n=1 Tax=Parascaris equorum TaxID=6256 RepID=A0A914RRW1_PAREQ
MNRRNCVHELQITTLPDNVIGYSTCHWCHVMARESFENRTIADILNENFVSIKVDREERPDVDKLYMTFIQAISGGGGWPMSWQVEGDQIRSQGFALANAIKKAFLTNRETMPTDEVVALKCYAELADRFDETYKGFGGAPKFPNPGKLALKMVGETLEAMARGGIHDHVGKLLRVYANYSLLCGQMKEIVEDIADYVHRNLTHPEGGFHSAQDADSLPSHSAKAKREGALYDVTINGDSNVDVATYFKQYFGVKTNGNCSSDTVLAAIIEKALQVLLETRAQRPEPHLDTKMLTSWNGLMISGLSRASLAVGKPELAERAQKAVEFIKKYMLSENGELLRTAYTNESGAVVHKLVFLVPQGEPSLKYFGNSSYFL